MHRFLFLYRRTFCWASWILVILLSVLPSAVLAGANPFFTLPLHAKVSTGEPCDGYLPVNCEDVQPTVTVPRNSEIVVFFLVYNYTQLSGLQTRPSWPPAWTLLDYSWSCRPGQVSSFEIVEGFWTLRTTFDCLLGPHIAPFGKMHFAVGIGGCLGQLPSSDPARGVYAIDCNLERDYVLQHEYYRLGSICAGSEGHRACDVLTSRAEQVTWGQMKHRAAE